MAEHAVIAEFQYTGDSLDALSAVEDQLEAAIGAAGAGEFDGNEVAADLTHGSLYMYGPDAERLFAAVRPVLAAAACLRNTQVTLRFGPPGPGTPKRVESVGGGPQGGGANPQPGQPRRPTLIDRLFSRRGKG